MYLIRRRADGKYWQNKYTDSKGKLRNAGRGRYPDNVWVTSKGSCWPFMSKYGAKHSQQAPRPDFWVPPEINWSPKNPLRYEQSAQRRKIIKKNFSKAFDEQFEIIKVQFLCT